MLCWYAADKDDSPYTFYLSDSGISMTYYYYNDYTYEAYEFEEEVPWGFFIQFLQKTDYYLAHYENYCFCYGYGDFDTCNGIHYCYYGEYRPDTYDYEDCSDYYYCEYDDYDYGYWCDFELPYGTQTIYFYDLDNLLEDFSECFSGW